MHQTFYVDVDEEVNSIISRLRKSTSKYNILAIAQQALILQSAVSLRLIKKEMDSLQKKVMVVTQDEKGLIMAKKVGFPVKKTIDEVSKNQETDNSQSPIMMQDKKDDKGEKALSEYNRLKNLGDSKYSAVEDVSIENPAKEKEPSRFTPIEDSNFNSKEDKKGEFGNLFGDKINENLEDNSQEKKNNVNKGAGKFLWVFSLIIIFLVGGVVAYLFIPKAEVKVAPKQIQKNINLSIKAGDEFQGEDYPSDTIVLDSVLIEEEDVVSNIFDATGEKSSATKKARGTITIYNDFSEASQILVATTRFLSEEGKLFRLIKNVTVPGVSIENGNRTPGKIRAEVVADSAGEEFNIEPTSFTIPGFEGSPKYDKFSARSEEKMKGGGGGESELSSVSEADIEKAKEESLQETKKQLSQKIKESVGEGNVFLEEAIEYEVLDSASFPEAGAIADNFEYQLKARAKYLTFDSSEVNKKVDIYIDDNVLAKEKFAVKISRLDKNYGKPKNDFENKNLEVKLSINLILKGSVSETSLKRELLGKGQEGVDEVMSNHPEIQKIDASITPSSLVSKIPKYSSRVEMDILE